MAELCRGPLVAQPEVRGCGGGLLGKKVALNWCWYSVYQWVTLAWPVDVGYECLGQPFLVRSRAP